MLEKINRIFFRQDKPTSPPNPYRDKIVQTLIDIGYENELRTKEGLPFNVIFGQFPRIHLLYFQTENTFIYMEPTTNGWHGEEAVVCVLKEEVDVFKTMEKKGVIEFAFKFENPFGNSTKNETFTEYASVYRYRYENGIDK